MIRSDIKFRELSVLLNNSDDLTISKAIETLRNEQPFEGAIELLVSYYDKDEGTLAKKAIEGFMNDLKDLSVTPEIIREIVKERKPSTMSMLVSSCWQSGLDYSDYSEVFARVFVNSDYITAIECLTVIEESLQKISREKKDEIITILKHNPFRDADPKSSLGYELIAFLSE